MAETGEAGRQADGRFAAGNVANPKGNPGNGKAVHFRALLANATTDEEFLSVWRAVLDKAKGGDMKAAEIVLDRIAGKVPQAMEVSGEGGGPVLLGWADKPAELPK
jgi:hypothetical protein